MFKKTVLVFGLYLLPFVVIAQTIGLSRNRQEIEQKNMELQAFQTLMENQQLRLKTCNNLPDTQASAFYFPYGTHSTSGYTEFQLSQSMEFSTVYHARKQLFGQQKEHLMLEYRMLRQVDAGEHGLQHDAALQQEEFILDEESAQVKQLPSRLPIKMEARRITNNQRYLLCETSS